MDERADFNIHSGPLGGQYFDCIVREFKIQKDYHTHQIQGMNRPVTTYAGKPSTDIAISLLFHELEDIKKMMDMYQQTFDPTAGTMAYASTYKFQADLIFAYGSNAKIHHLGGCWIVGYNYNNQSELVAKFRPDKIDTEDYVICYLCEILRLLVTGKQVRIKDPSKLCEVHQKL